MDICTRICTLCSLTGKTIQSLYCLFFSNRDESKEIKQIPVVALHRIIFSDHIPQSFCAVFSLPCVSQQDIDIILRNGIITSQKTLIASWCTEHKLRHWSKMAHFTTAWCFATYIAARSQFSHIYFVTSHVFSFMSVFFPSNLQCLSRDAVTV